MNELGNLSIHLALRNLRPAGKGFVCVCVCVWGGGGGRGKGVILTSYSVMTSLGS